MRPLGRCGGACVVLECSCPGGGAGLFVCGGGAGAAELRGVLIAAGFAGVGGGVVRLGSCGYTFCAPENGIGSGNSLSSWNVGLLRAGTVAEGGDV